jgi:hypothetical protein
MSDETNQAPERVGFCQDCGRPLTAETVRAVGTGVFCEPCLMARVGTSAPPAGYAAVPPYSAVPPVSQVPLGPPVPGEPHPVLAGFLGLIPGVGAMYNGQFAKGFLHIGIFAILVSLDDNVSNFFGTFVGFWILYQAFEAYQTAKARLEGLPLPNPFGFNEIGDHLGFGKPRSATAPTWATTPPPSGPAAPPVSGVPPAAAPDWVGYVPPVEPAAATSYAVQHTVAQQAIRDTGYAQAPYGETYTGPAYAAVPPVAEVPAVPARRFPAGAFWLIGLGCVILLVNLVPDWRVSGRWWPPVLFAGLAVWTLTRGLKSGKRLVCIVRWPVILLVLAIMFALHAAYVDVTFGLTCSVLLIVIGALLLLERTVGGAPVPMAAGPAYGATDPTRASFTTTGPASSVEPVVTTDNAERGGL